MSEAAVSVTRLVPSPLRSIGSWPVWSLPRWLRAFVLAVVAADLAAIGVAAHAGVFSAHDLALFGLLLGCTAARCGADQEGRRTRRLHDRRPGRLGAAGSHPAAPVLRAVVPIARMSLTQLRVRRGPVYRRVFTAAAVGLSYGSRIGCFSRPLRPGAAGLRRQAQPRHGMDLAGAPQRIGEVVLNNALIIDGRKGYRPDRRYPGGVLERRGDLQRCCRDQHGRPGHLRRGRVPVAGPGRAPRRRAASALA